MKLSTFLWWVAFWLFMCAIALVVAPVLHEAMKAEMLGASSGVDYANVSLS